VEVRDCGQRTGQEIVDEPSSRFLAALGMTTKTGSKMPHDSRRYPIRVSVAVPVVDGIAEAIALIRIFSQTAPSVPAAMRQGISRRLVIDSAAKCYIVRISLQVHLRANR